MAELSGKILVLIIVLKWKKFLFQILKISQRKLNMTFSIWRWDRKKQLFFFRYNPYFALFFSYFKRFPGKKVMDNLWSPEEFLYQRFSISLSTRNSFKWKDQIVQQDRALEVKECCSSFWRQMFKASFFFWAPYSSLFS